MPGAGDVTVVAAVIESDDAFLLTRRLQGTHLEGLWEFPGGKVDPGESHDAALRREVREELGVPCDVGALVQAVSYAYPGKVVHLHFYRCRIEGTPQPMLGQQMQWVPRAGLAQLTFPDADRALIAQLVSEGC
jgi:8-oxo-dGTP diphosphatase